MKVEVKVKVKALFCAFAVLPVLAACHPTQEQSDLAAELCGPANTSCQTQMAQWMSDRSKTDALLAVTTGVSTFLLATLLWPIDGD